MPIVPIFPASGGDSAPTAHTHVMNDITDLPVLESGTKIIIDEPVSGHPFDIDKVQIEHVAGVWLMWQVGGTLRWSLDGETWDTTHSSSTEVYNVACNSKQIFINNKNNRVGHVLTLHGRLYADTSQVVYPTSYSEQPEPNYTKPIYANNKWLIFGYWANSNKVYLTSDPANAHLNSDAGWKIITLPVSTWWQDPTYKNGMYVVPSERPTSSDIFTILYSTDGETWTEGSGFSNDMTEIYPAVYANNAWIVGGKHGSKIAYSVDGKSWEMITLPQSALASDNKYYSEPKYIKSLNRWAIMVIGNSSGYCLYSDDGKNWESVETPIPVTDMVEFRGCIYGFDRNQQRSEYALTNSAFSSWISAATPNDYPVVDISTSNGRIFLALDPDEDGVIKAYYNIDESFGADSWKPLSNPKVFATTYPKGYYCKGFNYMGGTTRGICKVMDGYITFARIDEPPFIKTSAIQYESIESQIEAAAEETWNASY